MRYGLDQLRRSFLTGVAACAVLLSACSGGGGAAEDLPGGGPPVVIAPVITAAPLAQRVTAGQAATFSVTASGAAPLSYQWLRSGTEVAGATAASYTLAAAAVADSGAAFSVRVSNSAGSVTSAAVLLSVNPLVTISITSPPAAASASVGSTATFSVAASVTPDGTDTSYQWQRNGADVLGATAASYTTPALALTDNGVRFAVRVSAGNATPVLSADALLTVTAAPTALDVLPIRIASGDGYSLAVRADGTVLAWGSQMPGGPGPALTGSAARTVTGVDRARAVLATASSGAAYALRADGSVMGWGNAADWALGIGFAPGASTLVTSPVVVPQLSRIVQFNGTLALDADGRVWGFPSVSGGSATAAVVPGLGPVVSIGRTSNTGEHTAVGADGKAWRIAVFALAQGLVYTVTELSGWPQLVQLECQGHCLGLDRNGDVWGQGNNFYGQLGDGSNTFRTLPVRATIPSPVRSIAVRLNYSFAVTSDGQVFSWGDYFINGRDDRIASNVPRPVPTLTGVQELVLGNLNVLVRLGDGSVWAWGYNQNGELGNGTLGASFVPVQATGIQLN